MWSREWWRISTKKFYIEPPAFNMLHVSSMMIWNTWQDNPTLLLHHLLGYCDVWRLSTNSKMSAWRMGQKFIGPKDMPDNIGINAIVLSMNRTSNDICELIVVGTGKFLMHSKLGKWKLVQRNAFQPFLLWQLDSIMDPAENSWDNNFSNFNQHYRYSFLGLLAKHSWSTGCGKETHKHYPQTLLSTKRTLDTKLTKVYNTYQNGSAGTSVIEVLVEDIQNN